MNENNKPARITDAWINRTADTEMLSWALNILVSDMVCMLDSTTDMERTMENDKYMSLSRRSHALLAKLQAVNYHPNGCVPYNQLDLGDFLA